MKEILTQTAFQISRFSGIAAGIRKAEFCYLQLLPELKADQTSLTKEPLNHENYDPVKIIDREAATACLSLNESVNAEGW